MAHGKNGVTAQAMSATENWIRETRIGTWFLRTSMWRKHVLPEAFACISQVTGPAPVMPRVVDIGCGEGYAFPFIEQMFHPRQLIGIDINPDLAEQARRTGDTCSCRVHVIAGNAERLALDDRSVDIVLCHQSFHHLVHQEQAAREFFRVLVPGGRLIFFESCRSFIFSWWIRLFFRHPMSEQKTAEEYLALLSKAGFEFSSQDVLTPYPAWSRPDFGLIEALGRATSEETRKPLVCVAAWRPQDN